MIPATVITMAAKCMIRGSIALFKPVPDRAGEVTSGTNQTTRWIPAPKKPAVTDTFSIVEAFSLNRLVISVFIKKSGLLIGRVAFT